MKEKRKYIVSARLKSQVILLVVVMGVQAVAGRIESSQRVYAREGDYPEFFDLKNWPRNPFSPNSMPECAASLDNTEDLEVAVASNPYYLRVDFDGNGSFTDLFPIVDRKAGKAWILACESNSGVDRAVLISGDSEDGDIFKGFLDPASAFLFWENSSMAKDQAESENEECILVFKYGKFRLIMDQKEEYVVEKLDK